jgi:hypothetical protein
LPRKVCITVLKGLIHGNERVFDTTPHPEQIVMNLLNLSIEMGTHRIAPLLMDNNRHDAAKRYAIDQDIL